MIFPEVTRVVYNFNPLVEVVCQLQFPTQLKLKKGVPAEFAEIISDRFPIVEELETLTLNIKDDFSEPEQLKVKFYNFSTLDGSTKVILSSDSISLVSEKYIHWEDFLKDAAVAFNTLTQIYQPAFFSRVGLRYKNVIRPSLFPQEQIPLSKYVRPSLIGVINEENFNSDSVIEYQGRFQIEIEEKKSMLNVGYGYAWNLETKEKGFLVDADFFTQPGIQIKELKDAFSKMEDFKRRSHNFFRWCISDELHKAMGPTEASSMQR